MLRLATDSLSFRWPTDDLIFWAGVSRDPAVAADYSSYTEKCGRMITQWTNTELLKRGKVVKVNLFLGKWTNIKATFLPTLRQPIVSARIAVIGPKRELKDIYIETNRSRGCSSDPDSSLGSIQSSCHSKIEAKWACGREISSRLFFQSFLFKKSPQEALHIEFLSSLNFGHSDLHVKSPSSQPFLMDCTYRVWK